MNTSDVVVKLSDETRNFHEICAVTISEVEGRSLDGWNLFAITRFGELPIFVMGRTQDEAKLASEIVDLRAALAEACDAEGARTEQRDQARAELEESRRDHAARIDELIEQANRFGLAQETARRMEADLAKARERIGMKAWGEIFADEVRKVAENEREVVGILEIADGEISKNADVRSGLGQTIAFVDGLRASGAVVCYACDQEKHGNTNHGLAHVDGCTRP